MALPRNLTPEALKQWRAYAEALIERAIALLDELDGDPDLEPSFGYVAPGHLDECEPPEDEEPSLGWSVTGATAELDRCPWFVDLEEDEGDEPDEVPARLDGGKGTARTGCYP